MGTSRQIIRTALLIALGFSDVAVAQDVVTYREINFHTQSADGQTIGCGVEFTYQFRDQTYLAGADTAANGSIWFFYDRKNLFGIFKLGGVDFPGGVFAGKAKTFPIAGVTIALPNQRIRPKPFQCEKPENFCGGVGGEDMAALFVGLERRAPMRLLFNRFRGGLDYDFPFGLEADKGQDGERYDAELASYRTCISEIVGRASRELRAK